MPAEEDACAERILSTLMRRAYRRPVTDADLQKPMEFYREAKADGRLRGGHRGGAERDAGQPGVSVPHRAGSGRTSRRARPIASAISSWLRGFRSFSGAASRMTNCSPRPSAANLHKPRRAGEAGAPDAGRPARAKSRHAISPSSGCTCATSNPITPDLRLFPGFRRQSAPGLPPGDRAALRERSCARIAACSTC